MTLSILRNYIMTSSSAKLMSLIDENKETFLSDLYLQMSNLILEKCKSGESNKIKITYMHTFFSRGGHTSSMPYEDEDEDDVQNEDIDEENPDGNDYEQHHNVIEKTVYVLNRKVQDLQPGCKIEFKNIDGLEHIHFFPFKTKKVFQKVGEYRNRINLYYIKDVLISILNI